MKKLGLLGVVLAACLCGCCGGLRAQDITAQLLESVEREQERIKRSQLYLDDLFRLQKSKDFGYVDDYLGARGWLLESTNAEEGNPCISWAFDRSEYGGKKYARSWFEICVYLDTLYELEYLIVDSDQIDEIKADLKRKGYERVSSASVIEKGLEYVYRDDEYEITLSKKRKEDGEIGADIGYNLYIRNYREEKEIEQMVIDALIDAAAENLAREAILQQADMFYKQKQYDMAKSSYMELISTYPEQKENYEDILLELEIEILCKEADAFLTNEMYDEAKVKYLEALQLQSNYKKDFIKDEISRIDVIQKFLSERAYAQYYYKAFEPEDYEAKSKYIEGKLKNALMAINENVPEMRIEVVGEVDTMGISAFSYNMSVENDRIAELLGNVCRSLKLKKVEFNGYSANAVAEFVYTIAHECQVVNLKNSVKGCDISKISNRDQQTAIQKQMKTAPYGKYTFDLKLTSINGKSYRNNKLQKMRCAGGPENALLSLIIPGLGMHKVTYGKSTGLGTMLPTYALLGGGIGFKVYSNKEYKKYHDATTQTEMDEHYKSANLANYAFYGCMLAGGLIWISDIIRVAVIGSQNLKKFNAYKHSYLGYYYNPELEAMGLSYTIKF